MSSRLIVACLGLPVALVILHTKIPLIVAVTCTSLAMLGMHEWILMSKMIFLQQHELPTTTTTSTMQQQVFDVPQIQYSTWHFLQVLFSSLFVVSGVLFAQHVNKMFWCCWATLVLQVLMLLARQPVVRENLSMAALDTIGCLYVSLSFAISASLIMSKTFHFTVYCLAIPWITDLSAMLFSQVYKHYRVNWIKLAPEVSPNKCLESALFAILFTTGVGHFWSTYKEPVAQMQLLTGFASFLAVVGDLFVSYVKRVAKVKDSGKIFGGHGGVLDLFDSFLLAVPLFYVWSELAT